MKGIITLWLMVGVIILSASIINIYRVSEEVIEEVSEEVTEAGLLQAIVAVVPNCTPTIDEHNSNLLFVDLVVQHKNELFRVHNAKKDVHVILFTVSALDNSQLTDVIIRAHVPNALGHVTDSSEKAFTAMFSMDVLRAVNWKGVTFKRVFELAYDLSLVEDWVN